MRKILVFLLDLVLLVSLSGCEKPESVASSVADMKTRQAVYDLTRETAEYINITPALNSRQSVFYRYGYVGSFSQCGLVLFPTVDFQSNSHSDFKGYKLLEGIDDRRTFELDNGNERIIEYDDTTGKELLEGVYFVYPYDEETKKLTMLYIYEESCNFCGVSIGDDYALVYNQILEADFEDGGKEQGVGTFSKNNVIVDFYINDENDKIEMIVIFVQDPYKPPSNIIY